MCGIVGVILRYDGGFITQTENSFYEMLYADAVRGYDATGAIGVEKDGSYHIAKEASEATWFIPQLKGGPIGRKMWNEGRAFIGHNRKKTSGGIDDASAHPFVVDDTFAMVHNGTLYNHKALADTEIDSQALAIVLKQAFDQEDWKAALEETLGKVFGAYATVMYDQKRDKIHFLRNKDRPLWIVEADNAWFFASEGLMATWILNRNGYAYDKLKIEALPEHTLLTFDTVKKTWSREVLTPKKSVTKLSAAITATASDFQGLMMGGGRASKHVLKFFRRKNLGKKLSFWADDFVEVNCPKTLEQGESEIIVFASSDEIKQAHTLTTIIDLKKLNLALEPDSVFDHRWIGTIDDVELNEETGSLMITLADCKPVVPSKGIVRSSEVGLDTVKAMFKTSCEKKGVALLKQELEGYKEHLSDWQIEMYKSIIAVKEKASEELTNLIHTGYDLGYDACFEEAEKEGIKLIESTKDGKRILTHPTKGVVYESPVALH